MAGVFISTILFHVQKKDIEYLSSLGTFGAYFVSDKFDNVESDQD